MILKIRFTHYLFIVIYMFIFLSCSNNVDMNIINSPFSAKKNHNISVPIIYMSEDNFNFGEILQGELVTYDFKIKNTGNSNLLIADARGSCGCTVPDWPREPIPPNKESYIRVTFNSEGREGYQNKTITLLTNSIPNTKVITINGNVIVP